MKGDIKLLCFKIEYNNSTTNKDTLLYYIIADAEPNIQSAHQ